MYNFTYHLPLLSLIFKNSILNINFSFIIHLWKIAFSSFTTPPCISNIQRINFWKKHIYIHIHLTSGNICPETIISTKEKIGPSYVNESLCIPASIFWFQRKWWFCDFQILSDMLTPILNLTAPSFISSNLMYMTVYICTLSSFHLCSPLLIYIDLIFRSQSHFEFSHLGTYILWEIACKTLVKWVDTFYSRPSWLKLIQSPFESHYTGVSSNTYSKKV